MGTTDDIGDIQVWQILGLFAIMLCIFVLILCDNFEVRLHASMHYKCTHHDACTCTCMHIFG